MKNLTFAFLVIIYSLNSTPWKLFEPRGEFGLLNVRLITQENNGRIWFNTENGPFSYLDGVLKDEMPKIEKDKIYNAFNSCKYDNKGNIVFKNNFGFVIKYDNFWDVFSEEEYSEFGWIDDVNFVGDTLFLNVALWGQIRYMVYNTITSRYEYKKSNLIKIDNVNENLGNSAIHYNNHLYYVGRDFIRKVDYHNKTSTLINESANFDFSKIYESPYNLQMTNINEPVFFSKNKDVSLSIYFLINDTQIHEINFQDKRFDLSNSSIRGCHIYDDGFFTIVNYNLYYYKNGEARIIPMPDLIDNEDSLGLWLPTSVFVDNEKTLWIGTFQGGVFSSKVEDVLLASSVIEYDFNIPNIGLYRVSPVPCILNNIRIDYYLQSGNHSDTKVELFNLYGAMFDVEYVNINAQGQLCSLDIDLYKIPNGIYFVHVMNNSDGFICKIIIQR